MRPGRTRTRAAATSATARGSLARAVIMTAAAVGSNRKRRTATFLTATDQMAAPSPHAIVRPSSSTDGPGGRPPHEVRPYFASFSYQAQSWQKSQAGRGEGRMAPQ